MPPIDDASGSLINIALLLARYVHVVASMLLVGGILFYEMVVPAALSDLSAGQQLAVFARARIVFRWITWTAVFLLIATGIFMTARHMHTYIESEFPALLSLSMARAPSVPWPLRTGIWWAAHVISGVIAILVALWLVGGDRPPKYPVNWLRLDLVVLLIVVFFATVTRHVDQLHKDRAMRELQNPVLRSVYHYRQLDILAATRASSQPTTQDDE